MLAEPNLQFTTEIIRNFKIFLYILFKDFFYILALVFMKEILLCGNTIYFKTREGLKIHI